MNENKCHIFDKLSLNFGQTCFVSMREQISSQRIPITSLHDIQQRETCRNPKAAFVRRRRPLKDNMKVVRPFSSVTGKCVVVKAFRILRMSSTSLAGLGSNGLLLFLMLVMTTAKGKNLFAIHTFFFLSENTFLRAQFGFLVAPDIAVANVFPFSAAVGSRGECC